MKIRSLIASSLFIAITFSTIYAQDRHFAWSYDSPSLPKGSVDFEVWNTYNFGRKGYSYSNLDQKLELEYGLSDKIQTSIYINANHTAVGPQDTTQALEFVRSSSFSFSNSWKFYISNPFKHKFGFSGYFEYYLAQGEVELEAKFILDKITEKNWYVLNSTLESGIEKVFTKSNGAIKSEIENDYEWENNLGFMHHFKPTLGLGLEFRNVNAIQEGKWLYSACYIGPSLFIGGEKYFLIFNFMPQFANLTGNNKPLELSNQERFNLRVLAGVSF